MMTCPICEHEATIVKTNLQGYLLSPKRYSIANCKGCNVSFALPSETDSEVYEAIYKNADYLNDYKDYKVFAKEVLTQSNPIEYLKSKRIEYCAVMNSLNEIYEKKKTRLDVLEVGCGLGYTTYALNSEPQKYDALGIDISETAISQARSKYGNHFVCEDIIEYASENESSFDAVILVEIIEHLPNIFPFLQALFRLIKKGGCLILTTPNRSAYPNKALWQTTLFPVHLWWFSEQAIEIITKRLGEGALLKLYDMNLCENFKKYNYHDSDLGKTFSPSLMVSEHGEIELLRKPADTHIGYFSNLLKKIKRKLHKIIRIMLRQKIRIAYKHHHLCAVITKQGDEYADGQG